MLVNEIKPIGKFGKNLLNINNSDELITKIIEKPLQNACKKCKEKNIETVMSSANKKNIMNSNNKIINIQRLKNMLKKNKLLSFEYLGKGYAWIMINYNTLSDKNREILFSLQQSLNEDTVVFVKENFTDAMNYLRRLFKIKPKIQTFNDKYSEKFKAKQLKLVYKNVYPTRNVFIRMPINNKTTINDVELFFDQIISKLVIQ